MLQIAAHVDVVAPDELYDICRRVRAGMTGEHAVGRVIARPFAGTEGAFERTDGRRDYALPPPSPSYLEALQAHGVPVHSVGKVAQLFAGVGIDVEHPGATNERALDETSELHRRAGPGPRVHQPDRDRPGLRPPPRLRGLRRGPARDRRRASAGWLERLRADDLLVLTADHGCDLTSPRTDHTREQAPLLASFAGHRGRRHDGELADVGASALAWLAGGARAPELPGRSLPVSRYEARCPSFPKSRRSAASWRPTWRGARCARSRSSIPAGRVPTPPEAVRDGLRGRVVEEVGRSGKYLVWRLSGDRHLLMHLRMTGALLFDPPADPPHTRVRFALDAGHRLVYDDPRRFGTGHLVTGAAARDAYLSARLGIEPLTPAFTAEHLRAQARGRSAPVKSFVLDQRRIAGVGNIYADEALFRAGIHPLRPAGSLKGAQFEALREAIEQALTAGIDAKGATIDDFRHVDGAQGSFQDRFLRPPARGRAVPGVRDAHPQARRRRARDLRVRALPAAAAQRAAGGEDVRWARAPPPQAASSSESVPARSAASSSWKPPSVSPSMTIWGKVIIPVSSASLLRPSGSVPD